MAVDRKRRITMDDIAVLAKVSKPTVSRALSNSPLVNAKTRQHVLAVAREHGYAVNRHAQKLRHKRTNTIGVSIDFRSHRKNHISDPFMFELLGGVSEALGDLDQDLLLLAPDHNDMESFQQTLLSRAADGFIFLGQGHREQLIEEFAGTGAPMVVWGARRRSTRYCVVGSDNFLGGELAGKHLLEKNRRNLLFVGDTSHCEMHWRFAGLEAAARQATRPVSVNQMCLEDFSFDCALEAFDRFLDSTEQPPDGVFAHSDSAAMACIKAFEKRGLLAPTDFSVVGYNDAPSSGFFSPSLTTVRQDTHAAGALLVKKLMAILEGKRPRSGTIETKLLVRET